MLFRSTLSSKAIPKSLGLPMGPKSTGELLSRIIAYVMSLPGFLNTIDSTAQEAAGSAFSLFDEVSTLSSQATDLQGEVTGIGGTLDTVVADVTAIVDALLVRGVEIPEVDGNLKADTITTTDSLTVEQVRLQDGAISVSDGITVEDPRCSLDIRSDREVAVTLSSDLDAAGPPNDTSCLLLYRYGETSGFMVKRDTASSEISSLGGDPIHFGDHTIISNPVGELPVLGALTNWATLDASGLKCNTYSNLAGDVSVTPENILAKQQTIVDIPASSFQMDGNLGGVVFSNSSITAYGHHTTSGASSSLSHCSIHVVQFSNGVITASSFNWISSLAAGYTLPVDFRPYQSVYAPVNVWYNSGGGVIHSVGEVQITPGGDIRVYGQFDHSLYWGPAAPWSGTAGFNAFSLSYPNYA